MKKIRGSNLRLIGFRLQLNCFYRLILGFRGIFLLFIEGILLVDFLK